MRLLTSIYHSDEVTKTKLLQAGWTGSGLGRMGSYTTYVWDTEKQGWPQDPFKEEELDVGPASAA